MRFASLKDTVNSFSGKVILLAIPLYLFVTITENWSKNNGQGWKQIHRSDVKGYYGYLLATFIRHDLGEESYVVEYIQETPNGTLNKYFAGTSLMMLPWFCAGHILAEIVGETQNGLSWPYLIMVNIGALIYAFLALLYFRKLLILLGLKDNTIGFIVLGLLFSTLLLQYSCIQPGWTHIYSFFCATLLYYCAWRFSESLGSRYLCSGAVLFALILLIRPVNGTLLLGIPVLLGSKTGLFVSNLISHKHKLLISLVLAAAIGLIQPLLWYAQTGNLIEWSYRGEGFHWGKPEVLNVLFSFRRGLFIYTPVLFLFLLAIPKLLHTDRTRAIWALIYFAVNTYIISAWWIWDYGGGFGQRPYIEHYPILFITIALAISKLKPLLRKLAFTFIALCCIFTSLQWVQFQREIIQHEYMSWDKYKHVFMKFNAWYEFNLGGVEQIAPFHPNGMELFYQGGTDFPKFESPWKNGHIIRGPEGIDRPFVCKLDETHEYSTTLQVHAESMPLNRALYLKVSTARYEPYPDATHGAKVVLEIKDDSGETSYYNVHRLDRMRRAKPNGWEQLDMALEIPGLKQGEVLSFYIWNESKKSFYIDNLYAKLYVVNPY